MSTPPKKLRVTGKTSDDESETATDAIELLKNDHREVEQLLEQCESAGNRQKAKLVQEIASAIRIHAKIEEEVFYPACRKKGIDTDALEEAQIEHDAVDLLLEELLESDPGRDRQYDAKIRALGKFVKLHVTEEEKPTDGLFTQAAVSGLDLNEIGRRLQASKRDVEERERSGRLRPEMRSFQHVIEGQGSRREESDEYRPQRGRGYSREYEEEQYRPHPGESERRFYSRRPSGGEEHGRERSRSNFGRGHPEEEGHYLDYVERELRGGHRYPRDDGSQDDDYRRRRR